MMSRWLLFAFCSVLILGCDNTKEQQLQQQVAQLESEHASLQQNLVDRDKYFEEVMHSINDVYADLEKARVKEGKLKERAVGAESSEQIKNTDTRAQLLANIGEIGTTLKASRKKITELQSRVKSMRGELTSLNKLVENLRQSLQEREQSIAMLQTKVQGLEATVAENTKAIAEKESLIDQQQKAMSTAYMIVGTRKELKEKGVISNEGGFLWGLLGSTTVLASGIDRSLFTAINKSKDQTLSVQGTIDEVIPHRSEDLFATAHPVENSSVLTIVQPDKFWQDNYLVIVVD
jgi:predicted  nucleic acid-binding Zn-ribbon protein